VVGVSNGRRQTSQESASQRGPAVGQRLASVGRDWSNRGPDHDRRVASRRCLRLGLMQPIAVAGVCSGTARRPKPAKYARESCDRDCGRRAALVTQASRCLWCRGSSQGYRPRSRAGTNLCTNSSRCRHGERWLPFANRATTALPQPQLGKRMP